MHLFLNLFFKFVGLIVASPTTELFFNRLYRPRPLPLICGHMGRHIVAWPAHLAGHLHSAVGKKMHIIIHMGSHVHTCIHFGAEVVKNAYTQRVHICTYMYRYISLGSIVFVQHLLLYITNQEENCKGSNRPKLWMRYILFGKMN